jgi:hypothetical protein
MNYINETGDTELIVNLHHGIMTRLEALRGGLADELGEDPRY